MQYMIFMMLVFFKPTLGASHKLQLIPFSLLCNLKYFLISMVTSSINYGLF